MTAIRTADDAIAGMRQALGRLDIHHRHDKQLLVAQDMAWAGFCAQVATALLLAEYLRPTAGDDPHEWHPIVTTPHTGFSVGGRP
jgi:hypothetical protein